MKGKGRQDDCLPFSLLGEANGQERQKQSSAEAGEDMPEDKEEGNRPITVNGVLKIAGVTVTLCSALVSGVWFCANLKAEVSQVKTDVQVIGQKSETKDVTQDREIDRVTTRQDSTEKNVAEMKTKLDVAVTLLERIDRKVGTP